MKHLLAFFLLIVFSLAPLTHAQEKGVRRGPGSTAQSVYDELARRLIAAGTVEERESLLAQDKELLTVELRRAVLALAISFFNQDKYAQSLDATNLARSIAERIGDRAGIAATWINTGLLYAKQDQYALALENYRKGLEIWRAVGRQEYIADALNKIGVVYEKQGDYTQALDHYERSLKIRDEVGDKTYIAESWHNIGEIYYLQGDYEKALEYYRKSLALQESMTLTDALDQVAFAQLLHNIGIIYEEQGNYAKALEYYERSVKYKKSAGIQRELEGTLNNIGEIHFAQGNYRLASEYFQESLKMSRALGHRALEAQALNSIARIYKSQGNNDAALKAHQDALKLAQELGNRAQLAQTFNLIGSLYGATRNYELALDNYHQSLEIKEALPDRAGVAEILNNIARIQHLQHNDAESLRLAERASDLARLIGMRSTLWQARTLAGQAYVSLSQPAQARKAFEEAISTIETMRATVAGDERQQQGFFEDKVAPYLAIMELLLDQKETGEALSYAERAKARVLLDVLQTGRINIAKAMTPEEQAQERALNHQLIALNKQVYQENQRQSADAQTLGQLNARLEKVRLEYEALQTRLYTNHPQLVTQRGEAQPLRLEEAGALINDAKTALLEFVSTEQRTYLFVLTKNETGGSTILKTYRLEIKGSELQDEVERYRQQLANRDLSFRETARRLYELLLKPAREQLQGKSELVIVPDASLWDLPFQALQPSDNHYLLEDFAISYAPSLTVLREMVRLRQKRSNNAPVRTTLLAFGNPATGNEPVAHGKSTQRGGGGQIVPLPEAEKEVNALRQLYGAGRSTVYTGADAREERFKRESGNYRILHLATHSVLDDTTPLYSYILLSQDAKGESEDGLLEAREIMNLDLKADLVVLSACETARGRVGAGEGMIGLTWSLFVAGSPALVVSQWKVESASTTELMLEFHRLLKAEMDGPASGGSAAAMALRRASLKLMHSDQYRHPFYWAGFVVVGEVRASRKDEGARMKE